MSDAPLPESIGRYSVYSLAGAGGNAIVYAGWDEEKDRPVALKLLRAERSQRPDQRARFLREAKSLARLDHPNIIEIYEVGTHDGVTFLALEYVEGRSLREWLDAEKPPRAAIVDAYLAAGRGLAAAHEAGVMHRDFKPDNVMLGDDDRVLVTDFGLARSTRGTDSFQTLDSMTPGLLDALESAPDLLSTLGLSGTPAYMALEQHFGREVDARADQFAFCVSLWESLTGERPYPGRTSGEISRAIEGGELRDLPARVKLSRSLSKALRRGLAPEPDARWPTMGPLLDALEHERSRGRGLFARWFR
ncbi:serine/threonine kinase family protein [Plesiocystis pacifica SIR-1]|uniref:Serine/threonine kinase family protein n=1 Tax=Plesiocystis pacifica SIR-1 TaxID=391625 RepID=A6GEA6_9BACT|nr:serine/threonine-protein kinase [Plesiocystis pacifica]EDM75824.1 serine/threonine kinase family protein [Plesiocystis pacifica SIR-1]